MNCKRVKKILPQYIENTLSDKENEEIKSHINSCNECAILYNKLLETLALLKPKAEIPEQAYYFTRLKQKMENRYEYNNPIIKIILSKKILQATMYLGSIIIAVYIGILIGSSSPKQNLSDLNTENTEYIKIFAEYQYLNNIEIETIKNTLTNNEYPEEE